MIRITLLFTLLISLGAACGGGSSASSSNESAIIDPSALFKKHCQLCHGADGRKGLAGAKSLPDSKMDRNARIAIITEGKGSMVPYKDVLSKVEIEALADYTLKMGDSK